ncbi:helix-turn-helix domain-containing protein [Sphingopyxis granuli]|jgi:transcriptional regulator with XRE-family HTH domain|uniref:helix-turn-helix domain-containing protein n=1 Tax=Sphingopyxis granuli TaxID=267128 RepID=UPI001F52F165|nr:helix-turn-helix transcriptional regulator [Sphingopyxis granuli]UNK78831.1 helix-turn-helix domain-containing protein [Sphingopyxis granuli]
MQGRKLVGQNLKRVRVAQAVSQEQLAFDAGVDRSYLGGIERGEENPSVDTLEKIARILSIELLEFFQPVDGAGQQQGLRPGRKPAR